ncbi:unnamed protein product [Effrenium voratum]|uniref:Uncharacterized protein n=1 Tax=Effrenium voratum TaxID=2562239 RepID=A0AA36JG55_9DINO|nr:unnamed protein product [Effrenium voratum]
MQDASGAAEAPAEALAEAADVLDALLTGRGKRVEASTITMALVSVNVLFFEPLRDCAGLAASVEIFAKSVLPSLFSMASTQVLGRAWAASESANARLLAALCGLRLPEVPERPGALAAALLDLRKSVESGPPPPEGTLPTLPANCARQVAARISQFFSSAASSLVAAAGKAGGERQLQRLVCELCLFSGTPLRVLRQAGFAAACGALQALKAERLVLLHSLEELQGRIDGVAEGEGATGAAQVARLCRAKTAAQRLLAVLEPRVAELQEQLLLRLQDAAPPLRRMAVTCLGRLIQLQLAKDAVPLVLRAVTDPAPEVRLKAMELAGAWFDAKDPAEHVATLAPQVAQILAERSRDTDPRCAASAVRQLRRAPLAAQLSDADFAAVARLSFQEGSLLRLEAALFVEEHLLPEPGLGIARAKAQDAEDNLEGHFTAEHGLIAVADFLTSYLKDEHLHLSARFVEALFGRAECFQRFSALADLCVLGEGAGAARAVPCLPSRQRLALLHVLDAALQCEVRLDGPCEALLVKLPWLMERLGKEQDFLELLASICRRLICHCAGGDAPLPRALLAPLLAPLKAAAAQRPRHGGRLKLAEALSAWAQRSTEVQGATRQLAAELCCGLEALLPREGVAMLSPEVEAKASRHLGPLLALGQCGVDLWTCEKTGSANNLLRSSVALLEARVSSEAVGGETLASQLLELPVLLLAWRARQLSANGEATSGSGSGCAGFLLSCNYVRNCCAKLVQREKNLIFRLQAFSSFLLVLHLEFLGYAGRENDLPNVPEEHLIALDCAMRDFFASASARASASAAGWRQPLALVAGRGQVTAARWLVDNYLQEGSDELPAEAKETAAAAASCMLAECEHEAVYSGEAAERLLCQLGRMDLAGEANAQTMAQVAAVRLLSRLRRYGGRNAHEACRGYQLQFRAAARYAQEKGLQAGLRLAALLIHFSAPQIVPGSRAAAQLGRGLAAALRSVGAEKRSAADLEVIVPFLRDPCCPLPGSAARGLATRLAADLGLLGQNTTSARRPGAWQAPASTPGAWPLVTALQQSGADRVLKRSHTWRAKMQSTARRRLKRTVEPAAFESTPLAHSAAAAEGWLAPLPRGGATPPPKRRKAASPAPAPEAKRKREATDDRPPEQPAKRQWRLRED